MVAKQSCPFVLKAAVDTVVRICNPILTEPLVHTDGLSSGLAF